VTAVTARASRLALRLADLSLAAAVAGVGAIVLLSRAPRRRRGAGGGRGERPRLLAIDSIYTLQVMRARGAEHFVTHRDLEGFFAHVWSVHPLVGADGDGAPGPPVVTALNDAHTMIEGRVRRFAALKRLPYADFVCAQVQLVLMLDRIVARESVAIVRGDPYYHGLLALLLGRLNGRPVEVRVIGNHDAIYETAGALAYPRIFRWRAVEQRVARYTLSHADSVVVASADNRAFALRNGARPDRVRHLDNASLVNPLHLADPAARGPVDDEFGFEGRRVVTCVTRLERMKHPEDVLASVAAARHRDPRIAAVIVGEGAMRAELEQLRAARHLQEHVAFAGDRDQRWIARMLTHSAVIVAPMAGLALVESALSGTPIAAYDVEWHAELLRAPGEGLLVPYRDTDALADAICTLAADCDRAASIAAAARARALELMQPEKLIADERALAGRLLAPAPSRS
jgi:glycosyltransferase involved in cell wall biosynthesis